MTDKIVTVKVSPDGSNVDIDAEGFTGGQCHDFMKRTMSALGNIQKEQKKDEYYKTESAGVYIGS